MCLQDRKNVTLSFLKLKLRFFRGKKNNHKLKYLIKFDMKLLTMFSSPSSCGGYLDCEKHKPI
uniref:Uncharacterized protein n=1 Tax=Picea sitchensis TaxID=3332 RepID=A9NM85_PICSI|nr:unknown [Picea sitchensis]